MSDSATLFSLAMALPTPERVELAQRLIGSVEQESPPIEGKLPLAAEIAERRDRIQSGNYVALEWHDSVNQIRDSLAAEKKA